MKRFYFLLILLQLPLFLLAQNADSVAVVQAEWKTDTLQKGIVLRTHHFEHNLFGDSQFVSVLLVDMRKAGARITVGAEPKELITTSGFGERAGALAALNGTFFDVKNGGSVDLVRSGGKTINETRLTGNKRAVHQQAAILISKRRVMLKKYRQNEQWESRFKAPEVMVSGPVLWDKNKAEILDTAAFTVKRHPRTAVGINRKMVMLLTVDGRSPESAGMSLPELQKLMRWLGNRDAINLDGGGSTTLWVKGRPDGGVVNHPSDNKKFDHLGQRKVANVLLVLPR